MSAICSRSKMELSPKEKEIQVAIDAHPPLSADDVGKLHLILKPNPWPDHSPLCDFPIGCSMKEPTPDSDLLIDKDHPELYWCLYHKAF
jgi:hypothetical protein